MPSAKKTDDLTTSDFVHDCLCAISMWFTASFAIYDFSIYQVAVLSIFHCSLGKNERPNIWKYHGPYKKTHPTWDSALLKLCWCTFLREYLRLWDTLQKSTMETANGHIWQESRFVKKHFGYYSIVFGGVGVLKASVPCRSKIPLLASTISVSNHVAVVVVLAYPQGYTVIQRKSPMSPTRGPWSIGSDIISEIGS